MAPPPLTSRREKNKKMFYKTTITIFLMLFISAISFAEVSSPKNLKVSGGTTNTLIISGNMVTPFIQKKQMFTDNDELGGFTIEYLDALTREMGYTYSFQVRSLQKTLEAVKNGKVDMGASAISITEARESNGVDFVSYFKSGIGVLVLEVDQLSNLPIILKLVGRVLMVLIVYVLITGHLIWLTEKGNPSFNDKYIPGVPEGMWWTIVTMSTVGYGDMVPKKWTGRIFAAFTIFCGIAMFGWVLTEWDAIKSTSLEYRIQSAQDLNGKKVAVKAGTTSEDSARRMGAIVESIDIIDKGYYLLRDGKVDAVVYDWPVLAYYSLNEGAGVVHLVKDKFDDQDYGLAFKEGSPLREKAARAHLRLVESGVYQRIYRKYFNGF